MKTLSKSKIKKKKSKTETFKIIWNGVPATARETLFQVSLMESFFASMLWHVIGVFLLWAIMFCIMFFGIAPKLFPPPKAKMKDITFVLNDKSGHAARHSKMTSQQSSNSVSETVPKQNKIIPNISNKVKTSTNKAVTNSSKNNVSDFSLPMPNLKSLSSGLGKSNKSGNHSGGSTSNSPMGDINDAFATNGGSGTGTGASSGFNKNATKTMIASYDISPYVNELKRDIRWNWKAPSGSENKKVELFLRIAKDGRLVILNVKKTSEVGDVDNAALNAVKKCLPLDPLPSKYAKGYLDIIFSFGSNSIGSRY